MITFFLFLPLGITCLSLIYTLLSLCAAILFLSRRKERASCAEWPKVVCLKPLKGGDPHLIQNLESFLGLEYPDYEVIFGVSSREDPAYPAALEVVESDRTGRVKLVCGERGRGENPKVRNLRNILENIPEDADILLFSDADVRAGEGYIQKMINPLCRKKSVGLVTSLYRIENGPGAGPLIESLAVESVFLPAVLVAGMFSHLRFALGASMALRKGDLEGIGGLESIENYLADDYKLGNAVYGLGKHIELSTSVVPIVSRNLGLRGTVKQLIRWNRTVRLCRPVGYAFTSLAFYGFFWAALSGFLFSLPVKSLLPIFSRGIWAWGVPCSVFFFRCLSSAVTAASLRSGNKGLIRSLLAPFWDIGGIALWLAGLLGREIEWAKQRYAIFRDGRMKLLRNRD